MPPFIQIPKWFTRGWGAFGRNHFPPRPYTIPSPNSPTGSAMDVSHWISDRSKAVEISGIRKVFELARSLKDPVNLSIGQPHFDVPESIKAAIDSSKADVR